VWSRSGWYLRRRSAEAGLRVCRRRGWEPTLRRTLGVWIVRVEIPRLGDVVTLPGRAPEAVSISTEVTVAIESFAAPTRESMNRKESPTR
jgi:hypothetical protein